MVAKTPQDHKTAKKTGRVTPPQQRVHDSEPTSASAWKKRATVGTLVTVPSGNTVRVRTPGMQVFMQNGVIPNGLMPLIQEAMQKGSVPEEEQISNLAEDPEKLQEILNLADSVTVYCFIEPKVDPVPTDDEGVALPIDHPDRDPEILYVDEVDLNDKFFIFQFVTGGGTEPLEPFRTE